MVGCGVSHAITVCKYVAVPIFLWTLPSFRLTVSIKLCKSIQNFITSNNFCTKIWLRKKGWLLNLDSYIHIIHIILIHIPYVVNWNPCMKLFIFAWTICNIRKHNVTIIFLRFTETSIQVFFKWQKYEKTSTIFSFWKTL